VKIRLQHDQIVLDPEDEDEEAFLDTQMDRIFQEFDLMFHWKVPTPETMPGVISCIARMLNEWRVQQEIS